ncbi:hypothetical protein FRC12_022132 [Ceratobasidium sp. 428]|nr:hypothetical protein FRC12_022132 [Ceratobasidium sp. 428]
MLISRAERPEEYRYASWRMDDPAIRAVFGGVISTGLVPQVLEAYGEDDNLIHPSYVATKLHRALVHITCTTILARPHTLPSRPKNFTLSSLKRAHDLESEGGFSRKAKRANAID